MTRRIAQSPAFIALVLVLALSPVALAAKGGQNPHGGTGGNSIGLVLLNSTDGVPHFGQQVTFNVTATVSQPWVNLNCYQNGAWVSGQWQGFFPGYTWGQTFNLGPTPSWQGGEAECTARLVKFSSNGKETTLATTSFHVYA